MVKYTIKINTIDGKEQVISFETTKGVIDGLTWLRRFKDDFHVRDVAGHVHLLNWRYIVNVEIVSV